MADYILRPKDIENRIAQIRDVQDDDEIAHSTEDRMAWDLIRAIAENKCDLPEACCKIALQSKDIEFRRWYA